VRLFTGNEKIEVKDYELPNYQFANGVISTRLGTWG